MLLGKVHLQNELLDLVESGVNVAAPMLVDVYLDWHRYPCSCKNDKKDMIEINNEMFHNISFHFNLLSYSHLY